MRPIFIETEDGVITSPNNATNLTGILRYSNL